MALIIDGTTVENVLYKSSPTATPLQLDKLVFEGVTVWENFKGISVANLLTQATTDGGNIEKSFTIDFDGYVYVAYECWGKNSITNWSVSLNNELVQPFTNDSNNDSKGSSYCIQVKKQDIVKIKLTQNSLNYGNTVTQVLGIKYNKTYTRLPYTSGTINIRKFKSGVIDNGTQSFQHTFTKPTLLIISSLGRHHGHDGHSYNKNNTKILDIVNQSVGSDKFSRTSAMTYEKNDIANISFTMGSGYAHSLAYSIIGLECDQLSSNSFDNSLYTKSWNDSKNWTSTSHYSVGFTYDIPNNVSIKTFTVWSDTRRMTGDSYVNVGFKEGSNTISYGSTIYDGSVIYSDYIQNMPFTIQATSRDNFGEYKIILKEPIHLSQITGGCGSGVGQWRDRDNIYLKIEGFQK